MITVKVYGWEFRCLQNGVVECRNEEKELDWARRHPNHLNMLDDHFSAIKNAIFDLKSILPQEQVIMPTDSGMHVPQPQNTTRVV